jgi:hypothetical protein
MPKNTKDENRTTTNENDNKRIPRKMTLEQNKNDVEKNGNFPNRQGGILSRSPRNLHSEDERVRVKAAMEKDQGSHESLDSDGKGKKTESNKNPNTLWGPVPLLPLSSYYDRSSPVSMAENNPTPTADCDESLGNGEEFVMLRVSADQTRC